jgi:hypothetical protein
MEILFSTKYVPILKNIQKVTIYIIVVKTNEKKYLSLGTFSQLIGIITLIKRENINQQ